MRALLFVLLLSAPASALARAQADAGAPPQFTTQSQATVAAPEKGAPDAGAPQRPPAEVVRFRATVDKAQVSLGEPFTLTIEVVHAPEDAVALPSPLALSPLTLRGEPDVKRDQVREGARTTFTLPLAAFTLKPAVPDLSLNVEGPKGPRALKIPGQPLTLFSVVEEEGAPSLEQAHHGPKPPVPVLLPTKLWLWLLLGVAALLALVVWYARRKREVQTAAPVVERPSAEAEAFARLKDLRQRAPWRTGQGRAAIFELSEIVRGYLGRRLEFNAVDLTSEELLQALRIRPLPGLQLDAFSQRLAWEDFVKFARLEPTAQECEDALARAEQLVHETRPRLEKAAS